MLTDAPPRKNRSGFLESDRIKTVDLPPNGELPEIALHLIANARIAQEVPILLPFDRSAPSLR